MRCACSMLVAHLLFFSFVATRAPPPKHSYFAVLGRCWRSPRSSFHRALAAREFHRVHQQAVAVARLHRRRCSRALESHAGAGSRCCARRVEKAMIGRKLAVANWRWQYRHPHDRGCALPCIVQQLIPAHGYIYCTAAREPFFPIRGPHRPIAGDRVLGNRWCAWSCTVTPLGSIDNVQM